eukprot:3631185-Prymnesium_polylepis.1
MARTALRRSQRSRASHPAARAGGLGMGQSARGGAPFPVRAPGGAAAGAESCGLAEATVQGRRVGEIAMELFRAFR